MHKPCQDKKAVISIEPPRNPTQTGLSGLPCDRACNSNITAVHFYSVRAYKQEDGPVRLRYDIYL